MQTEEIKQTARVKLMETKVALYKGSMGSTKTEIPIQNPATSYKLLKMVKPDMDRYSITFWE